MTISKLFSAIAMLTFILTLNVNLKIKNNPTSIISVLPNIEIEVGQPAYADGFDIANQYFKDSYSDIVSNIYSPWNKQVYMTELSNSEVNYYRNQYRDRANGVMLNTAIERCIANNDYPWWMAIRERTFARWTYAGREENGKFNLYRRMPTWHANEYIKRRGY